MFLLVITAYVVPAAAGSGIPEVNAYLNGVDAPGIFSLRTLLVEVRIFLVDFVKFSFESHLGVWKFKRKLCMRTHCSLYVNYKWNK